MITDLSRLKVVSLRGFHLLLRSIKWCTIILGAFLFIVITILTIGFVSSPQERDIATLRFGDKEIFELSTPYLTHQDISKYTRQSGQGLNLSIAELSAMSADVYENFSCENQASAKPSIPDRPIWIRHNHYPLTSICPGASSSLHLAAYARILPNQPTTVVLAFRGTRPTDTSDWCSNFRYLPLVSALCRSKGLDQYELVVPYVIAVKQALKKQYGNDLVIVTTGHSLGGGIAETAGMALGANATVTFHASPIESRESSSSFRGDMAMFESIPRIPNSDPDVVNEFEAWMVNGLDRYWEHCDRPPSWREELPDGSIPRQDTNFFRRYVNGDSGPAISIYEHGEVVAFLRPLERLAARFLKYGDLSTSVWKVNIRTNVLGGDPISQHSITEFACKMSADDPAFNPLFTEPEI